LLGMQPPVAGRGIEDVQSMPSRVPPDQTNI
jgi:hypothetical protein